MKKRIAIAFACICLALCIAGGAVYYFAIRLPEKQREQEWQDALATYYNSKIEQYAKENGQYEKGEVDVVFLGDSLTDGYDLAHYYPDYLTLNRGIGGDTTKGLEARLQVSVYDVQPRVTVMLIGANNLYTMFDNYESILQGFAAHLPNTEIVLLSLTSMGGSWAENGKNETAAFHNAKIKALAAQYGYTFVDLFTPLLDVSTNEIRAEYTTDGGHLTPLGYEVFTATLTPVLAELLAES